MKMSYHQTVLLSIVLALTASARAVGDIPIDHEEWRAIGWNDACAVAVMHLAYPKLGSAIAADPVMTRIGAISIPPGEEKSKTTWTLEADGRLSWDVRAAAKAEVDLKKVGFSKSGYLETIQDAPIGKQPLLAKTILSISTLAPRLKTGWPGPEWRWAGANYNPLGTCALLAFEDRAAPRRYRLLLARVYNPRARNDRAYAHASNARLLFDAADLEMAALEAKTAALLAPELAVTRYVHASLLALSGHASPAIEELAAAVRIDSKYGEKARTDIDFAELRARDDFQSALKKTR